MRVGQHHPVVVNRRVAAERPAIAGHVTGVHDRYPRGSRRGGGWWARRCDVLLGPGGAIQCVDVVHEGPHVGRGDGGDPRLAAAGRIGQVRHPGVAQVAVVAGHVPIDQLARLCRRPQWRGPGEQPPDDARFPHALVVDVAVEVVGRCPQRVTGARRRAEVPGPLAAQRDHAVGHDAQVVLGESVSIAVPQAAVVASQDVRDAVLGSPDLGHIPATVGHPSSGKRRGPGRGRHCGRRRYCRHRHGEARCNHHGWGPQESSLAVAACPVPVETSQ